MTINAGTFLCHLVVQIKSMHAISCADFAECGSNPCQNQATCVDGFNGYNCTCAAAFTGVHCENGTYWWQSG